MNAKSDYAARLVNDLLCKLGWHLYLVRCWPVETEEQVAIQYRSDAMGCSRCVLCDSLKLTKWLKQHATAKGAYNDFCGFLDKKTERAAPLQQAELSLGAESPAIVRRSMLP